LKIFFKLCFIIYLAVWQIQYVFNPEELKDSGSDYPSDLILSNYDSSPLNFLIKTNELKIQRNAKSTSLKNPIIYSFIEIIIRTETFILKENKNGYSQKENSINKLIPRSPPAHLS
jgi:hypothetical protein